MSGRHNPLPFSTQPWEAARDKFLEGLSQEEKQCYKDATLENIFYNASASQKSHAKGSRSWVMRERIASLVEGIDDYGKALDVYSNSYALVLCPIWGSIRVVLHIAREAGKFQEKLVDMFSTIGDALPRFQIYQIMFRNHERLLRAISAAYLDILNFCTKAKQFFNNAKRTPIPLSIVCMGIWKPFRQEFEVYMVDFRKHQKRVEKEAGLAHMIESARCRELELANQALRKHNDKVNKRHQLISSLQTVDYEGKHRTIADLRYPGTNTWLQSHPLYVDWLRSPKSDCLSCYGIPGSGKSVLASSIVDSLSQSITDPKVILCYYYFDYADVRSLDLNCLFGSLIKQVLVRLPLDHFGEDNDHPVVDYAVKPLAEKIDLFTSLMKDYDSAFLVLDGLDELGSDGQASTLKLLEGLLQSTQLISKVFTTSRIEEHLIRRTLQPYKSFELSSDCNAADIALFVEGALQSAVQGNLQLGEPLIRNEVAEALIKGASGMFLWVKFQMYDICEALTKDAIRKTLRNLPQDLRETYSRIVRKIYKGPGGEAKIEMLKKILRWASCARRPLLLEELEEAVGLEKHDTCLPIDRVATNAGERLISGCGNLVVYNREDNTVALAHPTVRQFFTSPPPHLDYYPESVHFDIRASDSEIGEICVAYLSFSEFETQLVKAPTSVVLDQKQAKQLIWYRVPLASYVRGALSWRYSSNDDVSKLAYALATNKTPSLDLTRKFVLLPYLIECWAFHTSLFDNQTPCWSAFSYLTLYKNLPFEFRPWNSASYRPFIGANALWVASWAGLYSWAVENGIRSFLKLLTGTEDLRFRIQEYLEEKIGPANAFPYRSQLVREYLSVIVTDPNPSPIFHSKCLPGSLWNGELIYHAACTTYHRYLQPESANPASLLTFLHQDLWDSLSAPHLRDGIFLEAVEIAIANNNSYALNQLAQVQIRTFDDFSRLVILLGEKDKAFDDAVLTLLQFIPRIEKLMNHDIVDIDLAYAMSFYIGPLETALQTGRAVVIEILLDPYYIWLLSVLALTSRGRHIKLITYLFSSNTETDFLKTFQLGTRAGVGSAQKDFATWLLPFQETQGCNLLSMAFLKLQKCLISGANDDPQFEIIFRQLEKRCIGPIWVGLRRCNIVTLQWLVEQNMPNLVRSLMPHYEDYIWETYTSDAGRVSSCAGLLVTGFRHNQECLIAMLEWNWPDFIIKKAMQDPAVELLSSEAQALLQKRATLSLHRGRDYASPSLALSRGALRRRK